MEKKQCDGCPRKTFEAYSSPDGIMVICPDCGTNLLDILARDGFKGNINLVKKAR
jgi:hypothetical protein